MAPASNSIKDAMIDSLSSCLMKLRVYEVDSIMPLFYVLYAIHEGHHVSIISRNPNNIFKNDDRYIQPIESLDGFESDLLRRIRSCVKDEYFRGHSAEVIYNFCTSFDQEVIREYYHVLVEYIISYYSKSAGKFSGISVTPIEIANLMAFLIKSVGAKNVYDPCAGLCTYALLPEMHGIGFHGQEISEIVKVIADIRIDAASKDFPCTLGDSISNWMLDCPKCDCIASEIPFGMPISEHEFVRQQYRVRTIDDYVLYQFLNSDAIRKAVLLCPFGICFRNMGISAELRKELVERNYIASVISLPGGILPSTGVNSVILVLNKDKHHNDIKFVYANDCLDSNKERLKKFLDFNAVIARLKDNSNEQSCVVDIDEVRNNRYSLEPSIYIHNRIEVAEGQQILKFSDLASRVRGVRNYQDKKGRVLLPEHMMSNVVDLHVKDIQIQETKVESGRYQKVECKCLICDVRANKFHLKRDDKPLFVSHSYFCFQVNPEKCLDAYLVYVLLNAPQFKQDAMTGAGMPRINYDNLVLPIFTDLESQKNILNRLYRQEQQQLQAKLDKLKILSGRSSDLIHNLGLTFTRMSAAINSLPHDNNVQVLESLNDNLQFALRQVNSTGADFSSVKPKLTKVSLYDTVNHYVKAWRNFGFSTFEIAPIKVTSLSIDTKVCIDVNLFETALDCVLTNAHQHGFGKHGSSNNKVVFELKGVILECEKYAMISISNNGAPIPDGFTIEDFVSRGVVGINSDQDGLGGHHIHQIIKKFDGKLSIETDTDWVTINLLLPIYITSNDSDFEDYEHECI